jgi:hypothetical protein
MMTWLGKYSYSPMKFYQSPSQRPRLPVALPVWLLIGLLPVTSIRAESLDQTGTQWGPVLEWTLEDPSFDEESSTINPFDVEARVTFVHEESGEERRTGMYYAGEGKWKFRFTGTLTGDWRFETTSPVSALRGHRGTVRITPNPDPGARGFLTAERNHWKWSGTDEVIVPRIVMYRSPEGYASRPDRIDEDLQLWFVEHGFNGLHTDVLCRWFDFDKTNHRQFDDEDPNPDFRTFEALELLITKTHSAGGFVHIWAWGDEDRRMTPLRWGIHGKADRRLQRYIAARLGPLPGWTMGYGFDLWEWVGEDELREWHAYMHQELGWPHLLGGRVHQHGTPLGTLITGELDYIGYETHRPDYATYVEARKLHPDRPIMMEDRFRIRTDSRWPEKDYNLEQTRRGLWHSTMAGGVGNIWGNFVPDSEPDGMSRAYPNREQILAHVQFFQGLDLRDFEIADQRTDGSCLVDKDHSRFLFYQEDTESIHLDLSGMLEAQDAVAVDTKRPYREIEMGKLEPTSQTWHAPHASDWAIAVGSKRD